MSLLPETIRIADRIIEMGHRDILTLEDTKLLVGYVAMTEHNLASDIPRCLMTYDKGVLYCTEYATARTTEYDITGFHIPYLLANSIKGDLVPPESPLFMYALRKALVGPDREVNKKGLSLLNEHGVQVYIDFDPNTNNFDVKLYVEGEPGYVRKSMLPVFAYFGFGCLYTDYLKDFTMRIAAGMTPVGDLIPGLIRYAFLEYNTHYINYLRVIGVGITDYEHEDGHAKSFKADGVLVNLDEYLPQKALAYKKRLHDILM